LIALSLKLAAECQSSFESHRESETISESYVFI
jgi:hypothetical protein